MRTLMEHRVLHHLAEHDTVVVPESVCSEEEQIEVQRALREANLITSESSLAEVLFVLTPSGRRAAKSAHRGLRRRLIQQRILEAIDEAGEPIPDADHIGGFDVPGPEVTRKEINDEAKTLKEMRLIRGLLRGDGSLTRLDLLPDGRRALDSEYAPEDAPHAAGAGFSSRVNQNNYQFGTTGSVQIGDHNTANVTQNIGASPDELSRLLDAVRAFAAERGTPQQVADVDAEVAAIEDDANDGDWQHVRTGLRALPFTLVTTFGEEAARGIVGVITDFIAGLT
ncbi:hypothetical protein IEE94_15495 [Yimella sp. cx-573]|nr:hypothetical protein [Yimella sp. cx-573]